MKYYRQNRIETDIKYFDNCKHIIFFYIA